MSVIRCFIGVRFLLAVAFYVALRCNSDMSGLQPSDGLAGWYVVAPLALGAVATVRLRGMAGRFGAL